MQIKTLTGVVQKGTRVAEGLGFHTANIGIPVGIVEDGVYKINVVVGEEIYSGIGVYFETRETFESHIFDFNQDIYGEVIEVIVFQKIRENKHFDTTSDLIEQIKRDIKKAKSIHNKTLTFGTFDVFHKGHEFYLHSARKYGDSLHTIIARDSTVKRLKGFTPRDDEQQRKQNVAESGICDRVILGDKVNPLVPVVHIQPDIICLGYDQKSFPEQLQLYLEQTGIQVVRMESFEPDIYKSSKLK